jgi:hypothetical protein
LVFWGVGRAVTVNSIEDVHKVLKEGAKNRATSATKVT